MTTPVHTYTPATSIRVRPERQRKLFDDVYLLELADSIRKNGLFHAIQVDPEGYLVTGECRLRAIQQHLIPLARAFTYAGEAVPAGSVPTICVGQLDPLLLKEIELDENLRRRDLTWQEQAAAHAELHALRLAQDAAVNAMLPPDEQFPARSVTDTAREIHGPDANNFQRDVVRQELIVAQHMDKPEVAKAATLKDAFKALKKVEEADRNRALALAVGKTFSVADHSVVNGNCLDWMTDAITTDLRFDVILTDPPYGMGAQDFGDGAGRLAGIDHAYDDSYESWVTLMKYWTALSFAITKPQAHAYVFCDIDNFHELKVMMEQAGWYVFRTPFTNFKQNSGRVPLPDQGPRRQSEWLLYAIKGKKTVNFIGSDVITTGSDEQLSHGAQKPVALYIELLRRSVKPGDKVLDTFGGTGTLLPAAHELKCSATVIEQNPTYYGLCLKRLEALSRAPELPLEPTDGN